MLIKSPRSRIYRENSYPSWSTSRKRCQTNVDKCGHQILLLFTAANSPVSEIDKADCQCTVVSSRILYVLVVGGFTLSPLYISTLDQGSVLSAFSCWPLPSTDHACCSSRKRSRLHCLPRHNSCACRLHIHNR